MVKLFHTLINSYPFYKKARDLWTETQVNQIIKGLDKYPEPFNPRSWSPQELLNHALEESVDLTHYLVGLKELLDDKDTEIDRLKIEIAQLKGELESKAKKPFRISSDVIRKNGWIEHQEIFEALEKEYNKKPPYSDLDD
jgi:hypothetical protein